VTKEKKLTNIRAAGSDDALQLIPPKILELEQAIEFIKEDELVEVAPFSLRVRKKILESSKRPKYRIGREER
jgi:GTP-binding protein